MLKQVIQSNLNLQIKINSFIRFLQKDKFFNSIAVISFIISLFCIFNNPLNNFYLTQNSENSFFTTFLNKTTNEYFLFFLPNILLKNNNLFYLLIIICFTLFGSFAINFVNTLILFAIAAFWFQGDFKILLNSTVFFLIILSNRQELYKYRKYTYPILVLIVTFLSQSLSFLIVGLGLIFLKALTKRDSLFLLLPTLLVSLAHPLPDYPDYPLESSVVHDDNLSGTIRPHIGFIPHNIDIIDRFHLKNYYYPLAISALILALVYAYLRRKNLRLSLPFVFLSVLLTADLILPEYLCQILPVQTLRRIIPGTFSFNLTFDLIFLFLIALSYLNFNNLRFSRYLFLSLLFGLGGIYSTGLFNRLNTIKNLRPSNNVSPSYAVELSVFHRYKPWPSTTELSNLTLIPKDSYEFLTSHQDRIEGLLDNRLDTRWWSTVQKGAEFITVKFTKPTLVKALDLDVGVYVSDYPRALRIYSSDNCKSWSTLLDINPWRGSLRKTAENNLFFAPQKDVKINFSSAKLCRCLKIQQTAKEDYFDWSVAKINLYQ
jgi:F5/8 type C domain